MPDRTAIHRVRGAFANRLTRFLDLIDRAPRVAVPWGFVGGMLCLAVIGYAILLLRLTGLPLLLSAALILLPLGLSGALGALFWGLSTAFEALNRAMGLYRLLGLRGTPLRDAAERWIARHGAPPGP